jgi:hypothetical protein
VQGEEDNHSPFDDDQIENQLENLLLFIRSTKLLNEKLSKEIQKVDEALGRIICILEKTEGLHKLEFDSGVPFRRSLIRGQIEVSLQKTSAENWQRELRLYSFNVRYTKVCFVFFIFLLVLCSCAGYLFFFLCEHS